MITPLFIRADATVQMGSGHLLRCLALGHAWQESGGQVIFITACTNKHLRQRLRAENFMSHFIESVHPDPADWAESGRVLAQSPGSWMVLDGYQFDGEYQRNIQAAGHPLLVIDDLATLSQFHADIILNQNIHAPGLHYPCTASTRLLLGTQYALLRPEFMKWGSWRREIPSVARKLLITLGGSDPNNAMMQVLVGLSQLANCNLDIIIIAGPDNPHWKELQIMVNSLPFPARVEQNVSDMAGLMAWADLLIAAGGSTNWEAAFMGLPTLVLTIVENQRLSVERLANEGVAISLGWPGSETPRRVAQEATAICRDQARRTEMGMRGRRLVDGKGAMRVVAAMRER